MSDTEAMPEITVTVNGIEIEGRTEAFTCDVCGTELVLENDGKLYCPADEHGYGTPD